MKVLIAVVTGLAFIGTIQYLNRDNSGIVPIGTEAVFLAGEACVVNLGAHRTEEAIMSDMHRCLELNRGME